MEPILNLPGVIEERIEAGDSPEHVWPQMKEALHAALEQLIAMRGQEGATMAADLLQNVDRIESHLLDIERRAPEVVEGYSQRLLQKITKLLEPHDTEVKPVDIVREVGVFCRS